MKRRIFFILSIRTAIRIVLREITTNSNERSRYWCSTYRKTALTAFTKYILFFT